MLIIDYDELFNLLMDLIYNNTSKERTTLHNHTSTLIRNRRFNHIYK